MLDPPSRAFPRGARLTRAAEYRRVFAQATALRDDAFMLLGRSNGLNRARLGLAISKRCAKRAVNRNQIKRLVRESFRQHQHDLPALDIVVLCRPAAATMSPRAVAVALDTLWRRLNKRCKTR